VAQVEFNFSEKKKSWLNSNVLRRVEKNLCRFLRKVPSHSCMQKLIKFDTNICQRSE
jgi:hypothetical protein